MSVSETHIHLHIPPGYQLAIITASGDRLTVAPIKPVDVRVAARELVADPVPVRAAANALSANVRGKGVEVRVDPAFAHALKRASAVMQGRIVDEIHRALKPRARKPRSKRSKPRVRN